MEFGKTLLAKELAKRILCLKGEDEKECASCIKFDTDNHPDFKIIEQDSGTIKIDQIRKMQEEISQKPIVSGKKVYIIRDCDLMTVEAQNCLLKTLEEPPEYAVIILTTSNESRILTTVKSRCLKIMFEQITEEKIKNYIVNNYDNVDDKLIKMSEGSIGRAIELQNNKEIYNSVNSILENLNKEDLVTILNNSDVLYKQKENIKDILDYINIYLYNSNKIGCIKYVEDTKRRLLANSNYDMSIDYLLIRMWEEVNEKYSRSSI